MLERLYEAELDHLHELEEKYHAHLDREVVELSADEQNAALQLAVPRHPRHRRIRGRGPVPGRARNGAPHARPFPEAGRANCPRAWNSDLCAELAAEEEEHVALLEGELEQIG